MTTGQALVDSTRRYLMTGHQELRTSLVSAYTAGNATITLAGALPSVVAGARLSIGLNVFYVTGVNATVISVLAGQDGSTDVSAANGSIVRVNPRFTDFDIWQALDADLSDLSGLGLYQMLYTDNTFNPTLTGYDMGATAATSLLSLYQVEHLTPGPYKDMPRLQSYDFRLDRQAVATDIASGLAIRILNPSHMVNGFIFRASYKAMLTKLVATTDNVSITGLQTTAYDLPPLGAAILLMAGREIKRNFIETQGDTRRSTEVPPGATMNSDTRLRQIRAMRIKTEAARLSQMYPIHKD
jgi:hypothetical protein